MFSYINAKINQLITKINYDFNQLRNEINKCNKQRGEFLKLGK